MDQAQRLLPADYTLNEHGWLVTTPGAEEIASAQSLRASRDSRFPDLYPLKGTDLKWVGELGESTLFRLFQRMGLRGTWHRKYPTGKPDFTVSGLRIDAKTVKRNGPMRPSYTAQISARHASEPVDWFCFLCYEVKTGRMVVLGAIDRERFLREATFCPAGTAVHANYTVRPGHEIFNIETDKLLGSLDWVDSLGQMVAA